MSGLLPTHQNKFRMFGLGKHFSSPAKNQLKTVGCEVSGKQGSLSDTTVLTRINGIIALKNVEHAELDEDNKVIHSYNKPSLQYHCEINVPNKFKNIMGRLFATVEDEDDIEQTTAIICAEGKRMHTEKLLAPFIEYVESYELIGIPDTIFLSVVDSTANTVIKTCDSWGVEFKSVGKKYRSKKILKEKKEKQVFGSPGILLPPYNVAVGDCCPANPKGTGYQFMTDNNFQSANLSCNESAVDYCINNNCLVYYNDFLNRGDLRILSVYTEDINRKLKNSYLFRSSNM